MMGGLAFAAMLALSTPQPLSIYSHNIRVDRGGEGWARRSAPILQALSGQRYDIVVVQEATEAQVPALYTALPGYHAVIGERSDGHRGQGFYEYNPIFYRADRFIMVQASSFWVAEDPSEPGATLQGTKRHGRVITWARLRERASGREVLVASIHIHGERVEDALKLITDQLGPQMHGAAVILAGDFNARPSEPGLAWLSAQGFTDARSAARDVAGPEETVIRDGQFTYDTGALFTVEASDRQRLDYVFACGLGPPRVYETLELPLDEGRARASDHYAVTVDYPEFWRACR